MNEQTGKKQSEGDPNRGRENEADAVGNMSGDPQRGGRLPTDEIETGEEPRPADDDARDGIPSRSFNL